MSYKTASKAKSKPVHAKFVVKAPGRAKLGQKYAKAKLYGTPAAAQFAKLHDAPGYGVELADAPAEVDTDHETELADKLVTEVDDGTNVKTLCETYQLKREELGRLTGFSLRALAEWANGKLPSQPAKRRLQEIRRLLDALSEIVKLESIPRWLHKPNPAFDRLTPLQVIELGEIDRLWGMVCDLGSGQPS